MACTRETVSTPARVEKKVARRMGRKMSAGLAAPNWARYTIMEMGMMVSPEVLSTKNMIWGLEADSLWGLTVCISFMAFKPMGVAALNPQIMFLVLNTSGLKIGRAHV